MTFHGAQTFFIDPTAVGKAASMYLTKVRLYFKKKPPATGNRSGISSPGAIVMIAPVVEGVPALADMVELPMARLEHNDVRVSADASAPTDFIFDELPLLATGREYAAVVKFDGDEDFQLWTSVQGDVLVGTANTPSPGSSGQYVGKWFDFVTTPAGPASNPVSANISSTAQQNQVSPVSSNPTASNWRPRNNIDLKFAVFCARFSNRGSANLESLIEANSLVPPEALITPASGTVSVNAATGVWTFRIPSRRYEYVWFDPRRSRVDEFSSGELAWQHTCFFPNDKSPAPVSIANGGTSLVTSSNAVNFQTLFGSGTGPQYVVVASGNTYMIRQVAAVASNSELVVDYPFTVTNSAAFFYRTPAAVVSGLVPTKVDSSSADLLVLRDSNSNSSVRFVNNCVESISVTVGGSGYSNTDLIVVSGFEAVSGKVVGGYEARAVLTTNSTGGITSVHMANLGCGFVNTSAAVVTVTSNTGGATSGSGAEFSLGVGMTLASEGDFVPGSSGYAGNCVLMNPPVSQVTIDPEDMANPMGTFLTATMSLSYYRVQDQAVSSGWSYHVDGSAAEHDVFSVSPDVPTYPDLTRMRVIPSWSNELVITNASNGSAQNLVGSSVTSNSAVTTVFAASNNDFTMVIPGPVTTTFSNYLVNDVYVGEETDAGAAAARGITRKIQFANGTSAEDLRVYVRAWKPSGTDVKVYARIQSDADDDAFDDREWTLLTLRDGIGLSSSATDRNDYVELGYGFPQYPNTAAVLAGTVTTVNGSANVIGSGTDFTLLDEGDVVRIYSPLFADTNHMVTMVESVTNSTHMVLSDPVANSGVAGPGMKVATTSFPRQAFNDVLSDNVVRYYSSTMSSHQGFSVMQLKFILLAPDTTLVPKLDDVRAVGVSS